MANERREQVRVTKQGDYARREQVVEYDKSTRQVIGNRLGQMIGLVAIIINVLLMTRIMMRLIMANASNGFVDFIYMSTDVFVAPFRNIVANPTLNNGMVIDINAMIAIVVYSVTAWILITLIQILFSSSGGTRLTTTYEQQG
ncbi:MAG: YggT family protein [Chloroflexota bacterium]